MRRLATLLPALFLVPVAACGSQADGSTGGGEGIDAIKVSGEAGTKPSVEFDTPFKVSETTAKVLRPGDGEALEAGSQMVVVDYVGLNARNAEEFDSSYKSGEPAPFPLEEGGLINGFVEGLDGKKVGSRVLIAIPSKDGYAQGNEQAGIRKGDSLVFVVDVKDASPLVQRAEGEATKPGAGLPTVITNDENIPTGLTVPADATTTKGASAAVIVGDGPEVADSSTVNFHYAAANAKGEVFESSWQRGLATTLPVQQASEVIPGLDDAIVGQTVGSRVVMVVPKFFADRPDAAKQVGMKPSDPVYFVVDIRGAA